MMTGMSTQYGNNWDKAEYISTNNWVNYLQAGYRNINKSSFTSSRLAHTKPSI
ncbi:hypothetical protein GCM10009410_07320 [Shewanella ulleungensis]|uniref:Uncharacterized protein n=1 Tax=Shewanella ulleungensis TaxID=2282699 RepID=A0ABQ2QFR1_9GAMM|nr:hypothetical protein GCM10009410_07320 [Shewanella ulleungensis]